MVSDPFSVFDLPRRFDVDADALHRRFMALTSANHPDRFADPVEQVEAAERFAAINAAHQTLADPERRANCLLELLGGAAREDDKTLPDDLLMDMMQVRQRMEQAVAEQDQSELGRLDQWAGEQRSAHLSRIAALFEQAGSEAGDNDQPLQAIRIELNALRYIERMLEQLPR